MNRPEETESREGRIRRIVADYREALRQQNAPSIDEVLARNTDLGSGLVEQLQAVTSETTGETQASGASVSDGTRDWTPTEALTLPPDPKSAIRSDQHLMPGSTVGDYRLLRELGRGGMGVVYEAEHAGSDRRVALKLLSPNLPRTEKTIERFLNEASLAAALSHPRSTFVYEAGERDGHFFISMELMSGRTLKDVVQSEGALPVSRAIDYLLDVLEGLEAAHKAGVIHRDVKPSNCFLDYQGRVKVGDFGLSKSLVVAQDLTQSGTFLGTPQFAAPEQFGRGKVDQRTDVFAAAATLYCLLTGDGPFRGDAAAVIAQIVADDPPLVTHLNAAIPKSLSRIVAKALSKDPSRRYRNVTELRSALIPYSTDGTSVADVGRRVAAFFIDIFLVSIVVSVVAVIDFFARIQAGPPPLFVSIAWVSSLMYLLYFAISEGIFSRSLGKTWLDLRVVDVYGERPGIPRAVLRALIIPGLAWLMIDILQRQLNQETNQQIQDGGLSTLNVWKGVLQQQGLTLAKGLWCLLICSSMRRHNGYRGLHELVSGTRVIRPVVLEAMNELPAVPYYTSGAAEDIPPSIGPYDAVGRLGARGSVQILAARDEQLDRPVWVYVDESEISLSPERCHVARATRQRWLSAGTQGDSKWHAFEAIDGAPLPEAAMYATIPWRTARQIWLQTAEELEAALADGTLPERLTTEQIWVDTQGRVKLSDFPLRRAAEFGLHSSPTTNEPRAATTTATDSAEPRALGLLRDVAEFCTADDETPAEALDLMHDLSESPTARPSLASVLERLRSVVNRPYRLRWDDRLGILAISVGIETIIFGTPTFFVSGLLAIYEWPIAVSISLAAVVGLGVSAVVGYLMRGGPAFWLASTEVRNERGRIASGLRCASRNIVAWFPNVMQQAVVGPFLVAITRATTSEFGFGIEIAVLGTYQGVFFASQLIGVIYSIVQPRRGLQDYFAGTRLVRRSL